MFRFRSLPIHQFANQLVFLVAGKVVYKLSVTWFEIAAVLLFSAVLEHTFIALKNRGRIAYSPAALSTGFNLAFMLGTTALWVYGVALCIGLGQKHFFKRFAGGHFLNPSNAGITAALLLFPNYTYITFTDWGVTIWFALVVAALGSFILWRVGLLLLPYVFLVAYAGFAFLLHTHNFQVILFQLASAGFLLFAFFMITDPKAIPKTRSFQAVHAVLIAFLCNLIPLLVGPKEITIFLALTLGGCLVPLWRHLEGQEYAPRRNAILLRLFAVLALCAGAAYLSPWNTVRNILHAQANSAAPRILTTNFQPGKKLPSQEPEDFWMQADSELYEPQWSIAHVNRRKLAVQAQTTKRFRNKAIPRYPSRLTPATVGHEANLYAGVAVGDLNVDGYLDVVLSRVGSPLAVWMNNRAGGFLDQTDKLFPDGPPSNVEHAALADFNNDSRLDLLVVHSQYQTPAKPSALYFFDAPSVRFIYHAAQQFAAGKRSSGGITVADLNHDKLLDFYISFSVDWYSENIRKTIDAARDVLYLSGSMGWEESYANYFEPYLSANQYAGMTALFTDFNQDGATDFLLGNDFDDPSFALAGKGNEPGFDLLSAREIENNARESMSYFPIDVDNDGVFELWENGISQKLSPGRVAFTKTFAKRDRSLLNIELEDLEKRLSLGQYHCEGYQTAIASSLCRDAANHASALLTNNIAKCDSITAVGNRHHCRWTLKAYSNLIDAPSPSELKYDVERFPKQLKENVLLQRSAETGRYTNVIKNLPAASHTGWTWSGFPFDVNNDGLIDIYLTTGMASDSHDKNRLLINYSGKPPIGQSLWSLTRQRVPIQFREEATAYGVDSENYSRGAVIADFDNDGDGDLIINNLLSEPEFYENLSGGRSVAIALRSQTANYYAIGATIKLFTPQGTQVRAVNLGGHWNTSQPVRQHFGLGASGLIQYAEVRWPNGRITTHSGLEAGYLYVIYE